MKKRWQIALHAADDRIIKLGRSLKGFKAAFLRNELSAADYFRRVADKIDDENQTLDRLFTTNAPPLDGFMEERLTYRQGQDRLRARITELCKIL